MASELSPDALQPAPAYPALRTEVIDLGLRPLPDLAGFGTWTASGDLTTRRRTYGATLCGAPCGGLLR